MQTLVTSTYFLIICLWTVVLAMIAIALRRSSQTFGAVRLLLLVLAIDTCRNLVENVYFGLYFASEYGFLGSWLGQFLDNPDLLILPKLVNIAAACLVISLLLLRWLPRAQQERAEAAENNRALVQQRDFDPLTGLPNRYRLEADLQKLASTAARQIGTPLAVVVLDVHGYRDVSDGLGNAASAALMKVVAQRLVSLTGSTYAMGDGEFALVFDNTPSNVVLDRVRTTLGRLSERLEASGHQFFVTVSAGVAFASIARSRNGEDLLSYACLASREAKAAGGGSYRLYSPTLRAKARAKVELDTELQHAHAKGQFVLHYQPQVRLRDGVVTGAEALLRWKHPTRGLLMPSAFIECLSASVIAPDVGRWILRTACAELATWHASGRSDLRVGVNLFPAQFRSETLALDVQLALLQSGISASKLEIEITENIGLDDDGTAKTLGALHALGVGLAVDDFGTGHASLTHLAEYPISRIKIDKSFVSGIGHGASRKDTSIVRSIIAMGQNLDIAVIAEGIETPDQMQFLVGEGCQEGQGFLFSKALDSSLFRILLASNRLPSLARLQAGNASQ